MIVLHGFMGSGNNFRSICTNKKITETTTSYLLDLRNHGLSEHKETMSYGEMADDIDNFIKENNIRNPIIMGHSLGGKLAM